jgi:hypothetical protein
MKKGPKYKFVFERNSNDILAAFVCGNYQIKQVSGKIIENKTAIKNLTNRLYTTIK